MSQNRRGGAGVGHNDFGGSWGEGTSGLGDSEIGSGDTRAVEIAGGYASVGFDDVGEEGGSESGDDDGHDGGHGAGDGDAADGFGEHTDDGSCQNATGDTSGDKRDDGGAGLKCATSDAAAAME